MAGKLVALNANSKPMHFGLALTLMSSLTGCAINAESKATTIAQEKCESRGKRFIKEEVKTLRNDLFVHGVSVIGQCVELDDPRSSKSSMITPEK